MYHLHVPCACRGTEEYLGMQGRVDIINNTLGKALGGAAGDSSRAVPPLTKPAKDNTYFVASNHDLSNTTWQLFSHECFVVWYCIICMYIRRWIHNWPQGSCSPIASALSALPFFQFTATVCGGPSPEGRTCTMPSGALLLCIIIIVSYDLSSGN